MLQEIAEQPAALQRTIQAESGKLKKLGNFLRKRDFDLIVLVARGSYDIQKSHRRSESRAND